MLLWRREDFSSYHHFNLLMRRELATLFTSPWDECSPPTTTRTKALLEEKDEGLCQLPGLLLQQPESLWLQRLKAGDSCPAYLSGRLPHLPSPLPGSSREGHAGPDAGGVTAPAQPAERNQFVVTGQKDLGCGA